MFRDDDHWVAAIHAEEVAPAISAFLRPTIGFLHTADVHVATFDRLVAERAAGVTAIHCVRDQLLANAREHGVDDPSLQRGLAEAFSVLVADGADVIVCTCSTVGGEAERMGEANRKNTAAGTPRSIPVLPVDRPMAARAVRDGSNIAVVAAVESTLKPTVELLRGECERQHRTPTITVEACLDAWPLFEAGDIAAYHRAVAAHVDGLDRRYDTVVLAQASMLGALALVNPVAGRSVLSSPSDAVDAAALIAGSSHVR